jgi:hypothetical protein
MSKLYNLARMTTATTGTGTITLGSAVSGFLSFSGAGVADGDVVSYGIKDGANSEVGTGTYTASGTALTRTVTKSTNSNAAISLSGLAEVYITLRAEDVVTSAADKTAISNVSGSTGAPSANNLATIGSSLVLLGSQTASASATLDFTSGLTSTYDLYEFDLVTLLPVTDGVSLQLLVSNDGGSTWNSTNYDYAFNSIVPTPTNTPTGATAASSLVMTPATVSNVLQRCGVNGFVRSYAPSLNIRPAFSFKNDYYSNTAVFTDNTGGGIYTGAATAINGVRFKFSSGNIASGSIYMYARRKS